MPTGTFEQGDVKELLQLSYLLGKPSLTDAATFSRTGEIAQVINCNDVFDVPEGQTGERNIGHDNTNKLSR